jgi:hypothetical protein
MMAGSGRGLGSQLLRQSSRHGGTLLVEQNEVSVVSKLHTRVEGLLTFEGIGKARRIWSTGQM